MTSWHKQDTWWSLEPRESKVVCCSRMKDLRRPQETLEGKRDYEPLKKKLANIWEIAYTGWELAYPSK
jgi:hypothetical protein